MSAPFVILAAGGTGGHVFPAEALAHALSGRGFRLALFTDRRGGAYGGTLGGLETHPVAAGALAGRGLLAKAGSVLSLLAGTLTARRLLARLRPDAVVGFGGYASAPTVAAASSLGILTAIHEQNAVLGRANRLLAPRVDRIAVSVEPVAGLPAGAVVERTGIPVRGPIAEMADNAYVPPEPDGPLRILILGGSQGARIFSEVVPAAVARLPEDLQKRLHIAQQCRPEDIDGVTAAYRPLAAEVDLRTFFDDVPQRLAAAHLLVCRAGASTVGELTCIGRPAILVPYPYAADDHQSANARAVEQAGGGWTMGQPGFTPEALAERIAALANDPGALEQAAAAARTLGVPDAGARLADLVARLVSEAASPQDRRAAS